MSALIILCVVLIVGSSVTFAMIWSLFADEVRARQLQGKRINDLITDKAWAYNDKRLIRNEITDLRGEVTIAYEAKIQAMANKFSSTQKTYQSSLTALLKTNEIIRDQLDDLKKRLDSLDSNIKR